MLPFELEHVCSYHALLKDPPEVIGPTPEGIRMNFAVTGGEVTGPKVRGKILAGGGDWITVRPDGVGRLDVRATVETHDGALLYITYTGVADLGEDGYQRVEWGDLPAQVPLRAAATIHTSHADYRWLNRLQLLNVGEANLAHFEVNYDVYAVR